jgi:C4-dicarboxylate-specific signal transduction histidine kinase
VQSFELLLRSPADIRVLSRPSWWTLKRTFWALGGLLAILVLGLGWLLSLGRQVRQRTLQLHEEVELHKRTEAKLEGEIAHRQRMETEVEQAHAQLVTASRQAGMAEVATSVLHNVGNVLNSVNVSTHLLNEKVKASKMGSLGRVAHLLQENSNRLAEFLAQEPGRQLPQYLADLSVHLCAEQASLLKEIESLGKNIDHIKLIVAAQQNYARIFGVAESVYLPDLVEDALRMNEESLARHQVQVVRDYAAGLPRITMDKHKALQVITNLIRNAKNACDDSTQPVRRLTVRVGQEEGRIKVSVSDNGVGIAEENITRIFSHGFTTRKDGHGFGLHSGAISAQEMGGKLTATSDGLGRGATFTLELPVGSDLKPE